MSRCYVVKVTWDKAARCPVNKIAFNPGDVFEDTPEAVCAATLKHIHHRRGSKVWYPLTAEIDYECDHDDLPQPFTERKTAPMPLSAPPRPINQEQKQWNKDQKETK